MRIAIVVMTVKTSLSILLIFGLLGMPRLGLTGAGIGTLVAHGVGLGLFLFGSRSASREGAVATFGASDLRGMGVVTREVIAVALPAMGERFIMNLALLTYMSVLSTFGTAAIAAYTIGVRLLAISWTPGLAFAAAASTLVGQSLGAGDSLLARRYGGRAVQMSLKMMCALAFVFFFLRGPLAAAFTKDTEIAADLAPFMLMLALAQPFMGAHFTMGGVLRGAGDTVTPLIGAAVGNWGFRVPLAWAFARFFGAHLVWVWAALIADHLARLAINGAVFFRGRWAQRVGATVFTRRA
jgi:putative MATE family efflux protein